LTSLRPQEIWAIRGALHHRLHAIQGAQQLHRLFRQAIQAFGRAHPHLQQTGSVCGSRWRASLDERFLRAHDSELVSLRSARTVQDSAPAWPMSTGRAPSTRRRSIS
jgi:hypothetical protein